MNLGIGRASNFAVRVLLAPTCAACERVLEHPLAGPVCDACWCAIPRLVPPICARCGDTLPSSRALEALLCARCLVETPTVEATRSAGRYEGSLRAIIHAFKYGRRRVLATRLSTMMRAAGADLLSDAHVVVPVPLSWRRAMDRGFNQADDLARGLGLPVWRILRRTRHGPPQAGLSADRRRANVRGAYALCRCPVLRTIGWHSLARGPGPSGPPSSFRHPLRGLIVVLVDDVMTTGETMETCGRVMVEAGAASVRALTAARAATPRPQEAASVLARPARGGAGSLSRPTTGRRARAG